MWLLLVGAVTSSLIPDVLVNHNTSLDLQCYNSHLIEELKKSCRWFYGEVPVTGLTNQMTIIYTLLSLSRILNSSLILGPVYSRSNFEIAMKEYDKNDDGKQILQFSDMFDFSTFLELATSLSVDVIHYDAMWLNKCMTNYNRLSNIHIHSIQRKGWRSVSSDQILHLVNQSGYNLSWRDSSPPLSCPHILRFKSVAKLLGLYNFRNDARNQELLTVHRHIRPAAGIRDRVSTLLSFLPKRFIALHARLEPDVFPRTGNRTAVLMQKKKMNKISMSAKQRISQLLLPFHDLKSKDPNFYFNLEEWIQSILTSPCYTNENSTSMPALYLASGIISSPPYPSDQNMASNSTLSPSVDRGGVVASILNRLGFQHIYSKLDLQSKEYNTKYERMTVELEAYVDLEVSRHSRCFIPAHIRSSFSYFTQRLRELDRNVTDSVIGRPNAAYRMFFI